jgi:hypothetical protein
MRPGDQFSQMFMDQFMQNFNAGINMAVQIDALPAPLPRVLARFFQSLGTWLSHPFNHLAAWLAYGIWVLLFAKLLGGVGGVDRFLGLTALYAIPNLLGFFSFVPFVGWLVALVGTIWGWAVYIRGVQVSQRFDLGKAILAAVLPLLILILLVVVVTFLGVLGLVAAANGSG